MIRIALQAVPTAVWLLLSRRHIGDFGPVFGRLKKRLMGFCA
jgi:hypothetical protein